MEKKQLNFSAPLMSARRYSSPLRPHERTISPPKKPDSIPSRKSDVNLGEVVKPGSIPFTWEQIPGKAKGVNKTQNPRKFSGELINLQPKKFSGEIKALNSKFHSSNDMIICDRSKKMIEINSSSESEDDNVTFSDAIETIFQHESFSINCSVSSLSQPEPLETKYPNNPFKDQKTRDFMMNRFLPAAKAMTLEPSQNPSKKKPREFNSLIPRELVSPPNPKMCKIVPYIGQDIRSNDSEEEEDEDNYQSSILSVKVKACGIFPWICSKKTLCLVNPLSSLKDRSKSALFSASKLSKLVKTKSWRSSSQKVVKDSSSNQKHVRQVYKSCELEKVPKYTPRPMFYSGELQTRTNSPYRSSRRGNISPFPNESPRSHYHKGVGFLPVPRPVYSFDEIQSNGPKRFEQPMRNTQVSTTGHQVINKSHYLDDSINISKVSHSIMKLPRTKCQVDLTDEKNVRLGYEGRLELLKARGKSGPLVFGGVHSSGPSRIFQKRNTDTNMDLVLVPPMPKSPSESWLSRQLPSVSPRVSPRTSVSYSSMNSKLLERKQSGKVPTIGVKWENIVKSPHLSHDHACYSEELLAHVFTTG